MTEFAGPVKVIVIVLRSSPVGTSSVTVSLLAALIVWLLASMDGAFVALLKAADQLREVSRELFVSVIAQTKFVLTTEQAVLPLIRCGLAERRPGSGVGVGDGVGLEVGLGVGIAICVGVGVGTTAVGVGVLVGDGDGIAVGGTVGGLVGVGEGVTVAVAVVATPVIVKFTEAWRCVSVS